MKFLIVALLLILTIASPLGAPFAQAASSDTTLKNATVNLYCHLKYGNKIYIASGSGVFISDRGVIVTNAHVAQFFLLVRGIGKSKHFCNVSTGSQAKDTYTASLLYLSPSWVRDTLEAGSKSEAVQGTRDFALLYVTGAKKGKKLPKTFPAIPIASLTMPTEGQAVTVAGYPTQTKKNGKPSSKRELLVASSTITNIRPLEGVRGDMITLAPSNAGKPGVSGGPVLGPLGFLIGIATTATTGKEYAQSIRALSIPYIDRVLRLETGLSLATFLASDLEARSKATEALFPSDIRKSVEKELRRSI